MKIFFFISIATIATMLCSCKKDIEGRTDNLPGLTPSNIDIDAGQWKTILLSDPTEFPVAVPAGTATPDYIAQINEVKSRQAHLSSDDRNLVKYWSAGAVLRWNEILRQLVANHHLAPYQNDDGTHQFPRATKQWPYTLFPSPKPH